MHADHDGKIRHGAAAYRLPRAATAAEAQGLQLEEVARLPGDQHVLWYVGLFHNCLERSSNSSKVAFVGSGLVDLELRILLLMKQVVYVWSCSECVFRRIFIRAYRWIDIACRGVRG